jgi:hypothetical protein
LLRKLQDFIGANTWPEANDHSSEDEQSDCPKQKGRDWKLISKICQLFFYDEFAPNMIL